MCVVAVITLTAYLCYGVVIIENPKDRNKPPLLISGVPTAFAFPSNLFPEIHPVLHVCVIKISYFT